MTILGASAAGEQILLALFLMLAAAKLFAEIFQRLRQPAVVGEILAGVILGPGLLGWVQPSEMIDLLAEVGVVFLLFSVGLETPPSSIFRVGRTALLVAIAGVVLPLLAGWALMRWSGRSDVQGWFVGTALVATSVGITARVLGAFGVLDKTSSRIILGAAVIDDILGLIVLAIVSSLAGRAIHYTEIATTIGLALAFVLFLTLLGPRIFARMAPATERLRVEHGFFITALLVCLGLSAAAGFIGIASIIGAFLAGMALAGAAENRASFHDQMRGVTEFVAPFFLVAIGLKLDLRILLDTSTAWLAALIIIVALATKFIGCALPAFHLGWREASVVGTGMMPRGEVGIVVAQIGLGLGVVDASLFGLVVIMSIVTTLVTPPLLQLLLRR